MRGEQMIMKVYQTRVRGRTSHFQSTASAEGGKFGTGALQGEAR